MNELQYVNLTEEFVPQCAKLELLSFPETLPADLIDRHRGARAQGVVGNLEALRSQGRRWSAREQPDDLAQAAAAEGPQARQGGRLAGRRSSGQDQRQRREKNAMTDRVHDETSFAADSSSLSRNAWTRTSKLRTTAARLDTGILSKMQR